MTADRSAEEATERRRVEHGVVDVILEPEDAWAVAERLETWLTVDATSDDLALLLAGRPIEERAQVIDAAHLAHQREWSRSTFGPGDRAAGVVDHIRKELVEIEQEPGDVEEWVDVIILAFDGAWRSGAEPQEIIDAIKAKQAKNEAREWPDWRTADPAAAIEHVRVAIPEEET